MFILFYHFRILSELFWPSGKLFEQGCQKCFRRVRKNTLRKTILMIKKFSCFYHFWTLSECLSTIWRNFFGFPLNFFQESCLNCILRVRKTIWVENLFSKFCYRFRTLNEILSGFCRKFFGGLAKTALYVFREPFWGGKKFQDFMIFDRFRILSEMLSPSPRN